MCIFSPIRNGPKKTHKQIFGTHPVPGQSCKFVYVYVFFLSLNDSRRRLSHILLKLIGSSPAPVAGEVPDSAGAAVVGRVAPDCT